MAPRITGASCLFQTHRLTLPRPAASQAGPGNCSTQPGQDLSPWLSHLCLTFGPSWGRTELCLQPHRPASALCLSGISLQGTSSKNSFWAFLVGRELSRPVPPQLSRLLPGALSKRDKPPGLCHTLLESAPERERPGPAPLPVARLPSPSPLPGPHST